MPLKQLAHIGEMTYASGARVSLDIPRIGPLLAIMARATFTLTTTATQPTGVKFGGLARFFRRLELLVNGRDNIINLPGELLAEFARRDIRSNQGGNAYANPHTTASQATTYEVLLPIYLCMPRGVRPDDTGLDFRRGIQAALIAQFATADCADFYTTPNGATLSGVTVEFSGMYYLDAPKDAMYRVRTFDQIETDIPASNSSFQVSLDKGSGVFVRSLLLATLADGVGQDNIFNNGLIEVGVGNTPITKVKAQHLVQWPTSDIIFSRTSGTYYLDYALFGQGVSMIPTLGLQADLMLKADVTKQGTSCKLIVARECFRDLIAVA